MSGSAASLVDAIIVLIAIEAVVLWRWRGPGRSPSRPALLLVLASGACLLLAVRAALSGAGAALLGALTVAGLVHAAWLFVALRARR